MAQEAMGSVSWGLAPTSQLGLSLAEGEGVGRGDFFPPFLGSRSASRENGNSDLLLISFFAHSCFLFSRSLTEGGQN